MRGYGRTDRPADVDGYAILSICADLVGLFGALGIDRALFCGHDWGGVPVWTMPRLYPDPVLGVIEEDDYEGTLAIPEDALDYWVETFEGGFRGRFETHEAVA